MRRLALVTSTLLVALSLTACGSDEPTTNAPTKTLPVTIANGDANPDGEVVRVERGQKIVFKVTTDAQAQMHVHSVPEHSFEFTAGESTTTQPFSIDKSGVYEVELHDPALQVYRLEVR